MADGSTTEQGTTPPPTGERKGFLGRFKREAKPAAAPQTPPPKEALPGKMGKVMAELKKKDQELEGNLISEFGEGESKFIALPSPLKPEGKYTDAPGEGVKAFKDYLIITADGFKILRAKGGEYTEADAEFKTRWPGQGKLKHGENDNAINEFNNIVRRLILRGNLRHLSLQSLSHQNENEGGGYSYSGGVHSLNFGKGPSLEFSQNSYDSTVRFNNPSDQLRVYMGHNQGGSGETMDRGLREIRGDAAELILAPDPAEVTEIMQLNITEAKERVDNAKAAKLAEEARKLAEAEAARKPETDKLAAEEARKQEVAKNTVTQSQAADSVLDILRKS